MTVLPVPNAAYVEVAPAVARRWLDAAASLPRFDPVRMYEPAVQRRLHAAVQASDPAALQQLVVAVETGLRAAPHAVVVRGLSWDPDDHLCVALNAAFGGLVAGRYHPPRSQIVHRLQVQTELTGDKGTMRGAESFHSDCATHARPADLLTMVCVRPDEGGGGSTRLLTTPQVRALLRARGGDELIDWFERTPLPFRILDPGDGPRYHDKAAVIRDYLGWRGFDPRGEGVVRRPVLQGDRMLWSRYVIEHGFLLLGEQLDADARAALDLLSDALLDPPEQYDCPLRAGDLLLSDNLRTLHTRTPLTHDYASSTRLMLRCWVCRDRPYEERPQSPDHRSSQETP